MDKNMKIAIIIIVILVVILVAVIVASKSEVLSSPTTQCNDRVDNDGDRLCDYIKSRPSCRDGSTKGDSGCSSTSDTTEASCVTGSTGCGVGECRRTSTCVNDQVSCTPGSPSTEVCDGKDNDCDGSIDEGGVCPTNGTGPATNQTNSTA